MSEWILGWAAKMKPNYSRLKTLIKTSSISSVVQTQTPDKKPAVYCSMSGGDGRYIEGSLQDFFGRLLRSEAGRPDYRDEQRGFDRDMPRP